MKQPFESRHLRRYFLMYGGVVVFVILFYLANSYFQVPKAVEKRIFETEMPEPAEQNDTASEAVKSEPSAFKLLQKAY